ncbi:hypothetical protein [Spirosoma endophyticum]|uniref:Uncharacterized protein n=1 Tax=Spirosoma endophyticum TaxID=662367 RepID=A0A1I2BC26_9BACT|nr:hypothetical protein [Spirosoma endophyticum]SFE52853.1 hypothetical protein SAMN05216167_11534 [Spirosoma endophyticum]
MKTLLFLFCAGTLGFLGYMGYMSNPSEKADHHAANSVAYKPFRYSKAAASYLYSPSGSTLTTESDLVSATIFPNHIKLSRKDKYQFKGLFDLPKESFTYVAKCLSQDDLNRLILYGITLIRQQPQKANQYASRLSVCHLLHKSLPEELAQPSDVMSVPSNQTHYLPGSSPLRGVVGGTDVVDLLPGSTFIPYKSLIDLLGSLLIFFYYCTTGLCCLLVAGFVGYHLMHLPWQQSISLTLSPRPEEFFAPNRETSQDSANPPG